MASLDTDVTMVPVGEGSSGASTSSSSSKKPKRFEIKKWNAVALWAWDIVVDNCAICRNHIMDLCEIVALSAKLTKLVPQARSVLLLGEFVTMHFTSTASADGSKHVKYAHWIIVSGNFRSMATRSLVHLNSWICFRSNVACFEVEYLNHHVFLFASLDAKP
ncbi:uncharacterized protein LOC130784420 isoform X1 [Actinidia eriantha]|uniref:uncharacterized protein LOC130784420 isoform X1 n=1 Tax=Actinidia eriantha TaxID=165200 RepID=UPI00258CE307|nr:uncharacterized protein LOC130784420 isoform X1 [Actinidia eriantha]